MRWPEQAGAASGVAWRASVLVRSIVAVVARDLHADAACPRPRPRPSAVSDAPTHHQLSSSSSSGALCRARYGAVEPAKLLLLDLRVDRSPLSCTYRSGSAPTVSLCQRGCRSSCPGGGWGAGVPYVGRINVKLVGLRGPRRGGFFTPSDVSEPERRLGLSPFGAGRRVGASERAAQHTCRAAVGC